MSAGKLSSRRQFVQQGMLLGCGLLAPRFARAQGEAAVVHTPCGALRGERTGTVRVFRGVPFAEPPIGLLRFRPPVPKKPWTDLRDATRFASAALQQDDRDVSQSEDCLYLNLWAPERQRDQQGLPVFVWIHGGGFTGGESFAPIFDGTGFAQKGVIVVTVGYRLGVFGFLDMEPLLGPGYAGAANHALQDVMVALAWVQKNIEAFGGDPRRVTVGGESAGAKLTDLLMGVPAARGLFSGMISESGGADRIWPRSTAEAVAEGFGKQWTAAGHAVADLKTAPGRDLIDVQTSFIKSWPQHFPLRCEMDGVLFPRMPLETIAAGAGKGKRLLIGTNRDESALFLGPHPKDDPTAADLGNMDLTAFRRVYAQYATLYPEMTEEQRRIRALTAEEYWVPSTRVAEAAVSSGTRAWAYELEFAPDKGRFRGEAYHSEDLGLVWNKPSKGEASAVVLAQQMNEAWSAFLQGKAPSAAGLPAWPEYTLPTRSTMMLNETSRVENDPQAAELRAWNALEPRGRS